MAGKTPPVKTFPGPRNRVEWVPETGTETPKFSVPETRTTGPVPETRTTIDISGGGGAKGGESRRKSKPEEEACRYCGEVACKGKLTELFPEFFIHAECVAAWQVAS